MKNLVPFLLIVIGTMMVMAAGVMPLFTWNVNVESTSFSPSYRLDVEPSPWITGLDESLDDKWIVLRRIGISQEGNFCLKGGYVNVAVERSSSEASLEHFWTKVGQMSSFWLVCSGVIGAIVALVYAMCMTLFVDEKSFLEGVLAGLVGIGLCAISVIVLDALGPTSFPHYPALLADDCVGSLTLRASLQRFHWETIATLTIGVVLEVLAVVLMVRGLAIVLWHKKNEREALTNNVLETT